MKKEDLTALGLTEEQAEKVISMHNEGVESEKKKTQQAKDDLKAVQDQLEQRVHDMEELQKSVGEGENAKKQLEALQEKYTQETEQFKAQIAERDYSDAVTRAISDKGIKFSSKAAERDYINGLKTNRLELKDGNLVGFDTYHASQVEADPGAFLPDKPVPKFAQPVGMGGPPPKKISRAAELAAQYQANQYGVVKEM